MSKLINKTCFKIDKENAKAMITGFYKDGKTIHQSIYCRVYNPFRNYRLITLNKHPSKFQLSSIGKNLNIYYFDIEYKYIVGIVKHYTIKNCWDNVEFWREMCTNGLFDIWEPMAPIDRFEQSAREPKNYNIALLRVYEISNKFYEYEIESVSDRVDNLAMGYKDVIIKKPIISDNDFKKLKAKLEITLEKYNR